MCIQFVSTKSIHREHLIARENIWLPAGRQFLRLPRTVRSSRAFDLKAAIRAAVAISASIATRLRSYSISFDPMRFFNSLTIRDSAFLHVLPFFWLGVSPEW